eukprot:7197956-Karenia_brevis.AAC.1
MDPQEKALWIEKARLRALLGDRKSTRASTRSGLACWLAFIGLLSYFFSFPHDDVYPGSKAYFPPSLTALLAWCSLFTCKGTLANYLSYVRTGCMIVEAPTEVFEHPAIRKANGVEARSGLHSRRTPLFVQRDTVEKIVGLTKTSPSSMLFGMLFLLTYVYLLRLPSEALLLQVKAGPYNVNLVGEELVITLARRKNRPGGS